MLSTSFEFRRKRPTRFKATLTFADGTVEELSGSDVMSNTATFSDAVSSSGSFDIGAAIINRFDVTLNNFGRKYDEYDFTGATIVPHVGAELDAIGEETGEHEVEWLQKGVFLVDQPESYGNTIGLSALDRMSLLERPYSDVRSTTYPATLGTIVRDICTACGLSLQTPSFPNSSYVVDARPNDDALTCLQVVSFAAQASGNFARCDNVGRLELKWYDTSAAESGDWLDGGWFDADTPYSTGDAADGGSFLDYSDGYVADGGSFDSGRIAFIHSVSSITVSTDDVVVTGIRVTASDEVEEDGSIGDDGETVLNGTEGYVLEIEGNPLVQFGKAAEVAAQVAARVVGMRFRPLDVSAVGNPAFEAGDPVVVTDRLQNQYAGYITSTVYKLGGFQAVSCSAETPGRNSASSYSAATRAYVAARNAARAEKTAREAAIADLAEQLAESSGLYMTAQTQPDQSVIYYMHDKPTLAESQVVWKLTANAFGVSTDGGTTYPYGFDVSGNAILNRIYAIGINADYIETGSITVKDGNNAVLFKADVGTGQVNIGGFTVSDKDMHGVDGLSTIDVTPSGVTVASGTKSMFLGAGELVARYAGTTVLETAKLGTLVWQPSGQLAMTGFGIEADDFIINADTLYVQDGGLGVAVNPTATLTRGRNIWEMGYSPVYDSSNVLVGAQLTFCTTTDAYVHGMLTSTGYVTNNVFTVAMKSYVDAIELRLRNAEVYTDIVEGGKGWSSLKRGAYTYEFTHGVLTDVVYDSTATPKTGTLSGYLPQSMNTDGTARTWRQISLAFVDGELKSNGTSL